MDVISYLFYPSTEQDLALLDFHFPCHTWKLADTLAGTDIIPFPMIPWDPFIPDLNR
jgi:hypothetical protein